MAKDDSVVSFIPLIIVPTDDLCNDCIPSGPLLPSGTYSDVVLDVRVENTTPNKGDVPSEGKVYDVTQSELQIRRKITPMHPMNVDRSKWLPGNWRFATKVCTTRATTCVVDRYYIEPVSEVNLCQSMRWIIS
uniref:Uncharacterized protein n=1 Tax=Solanum tuberosum TaxID=4113 RepID=M1C9H2_SOLTU